MISEENNEKSTETIDQITPNLLHKPVSDLLTNLYTSEIISQTCGIDINLIEEKNEKILRFFKCIFCFDIVLDPVQCGTCNNIFCRRCIDKYTDLFPFKCPFCNNFKPEKLNRKLKEILEDFHVKCESCDRTFDYERYQKHLNECTKMLYICKNPFCEYKGYIDEIKAHVKICEKRTYYCDLKDNGCRWTGNLNRLSKHLDICGFNKCPFENCKFIGTLRRLNKHKEYYHLNGGSFKAASKRNLIKKQQEEVFFSDLFEQNVFQ